DRYATTSFRPPSEPAGRWGGSTEEAAEPEAIQFEEPRPDTVEDPVVTSPSPPRPPPPSFDIGGTEEAVAPSPSTEDHALPRMLPKHETAGRPARVIA